MGFSEAVEALKGLEGAAEHIGAILTHVESLKNESIGHRTKAKESADKLTATLKSLSDHGIDTNSDISEQIASFTSGKKTTDETQRKLTALEKELGDWKAKDAEKTARLKRKTVEATFTNALKENFYAADMVLEGLFSKGIIGVDDDEKPFVKVGEEYLDPQTGVAKLRELPELKTAVINKQNAGGGSTNNGGSQSKTKSLADFSAMGAKEKAAFMADGGKII